MYYLNARYYWPAVGRFITRDAFHGFEDEPESLNQYAYSKNNPVMYIDASGYYYWKVGKWKLKALTHLLKSGAIFNATRGWLSYYQRKRLRESAYQVGLKLEWILKRYDTVVARTVDDTIYRVLVSNGMRGTTARTISNVLVNVFL